MPFFYMLSADGAVHVTRTLYRYRPASVWALCRLCLADREQRLVLRDIRDALMIGFNLKRKGQDEAESQAALDAVEEMMQMFGGDDE